MDFNSTDEETSDVECGGRDETSEAAPCTDFKRQCTRRGAAAEQQLCGTPGCRLPDFHLGPCTSRPVLGPREKRPSARMLESIASAADCARTLGPAKQQGADDAEDDMDNDHAGNRDKLVTEAEGLK